MKDETVVRFDRGTSIDDVRLDNGFLKTSATVGRTGVLEYRQLDGSVRRELRLPEEVFSPASLESLELIPVTLRHPPRSDEGGGFVNPKNSKKYTVGSASHPYTVNENRVGVKVLIQDQEAIDAIQSGLREVSPGYTTHLEFSPGVYEGQPYDAIQRNIRYNHVALVDKGRQGETVRLHLDSDAIEIVGQEEVNMKMVKISLDGVDFELPEAAKQAVERELSRGAEEAKQLKDQLSAESARADAAEAALASEKAAFDEFKENAPKLIEESTKARLGLERVAQDILGADEELKSLDDAEIKRAVIAKVSPAVAEKLDDKDEVYLDASFDFAVETHKTRPNPGLNKVKGQGEKPSESKNDSLSPAEAYAEEMKNLWRKK